MIDLRVIGFGALVIFATVAFAVHLFNRNNELALLNSISHSIAAVDNFRAAHPAQRNLTTNDVPELASNSYMAAHHAELATYLVDGLSGYKLKLDALTRSQCERVNRYLIANQEQFSEIFLNEMPTEFSVSPGCAPSNTLAIVKR